MVIIIFKKLKDTKYNLYVIPAIIYDIIHL